MLEERTAIQNCEPVAIAEAAIQKDPNEWHKKVHEKATALGAELVGIAPMDPLWIFEGCKTNKPWIIMLGVVMDHGILSSAPELATRLGDLKIEPLFVIKPVILIPRLGIDDCSVAKRHLGASSGV